MISTNGPVFCSWDKVERLVVMLHGRGASGDNMIALAPLMSKDLPNTQFVAPHACMPYGIGYTWFSDSLKNMQEGTTVREIIESVGVVNRFIDGQLNALAMSDDKLSLVGFSQGAMLALYVGLSRPQKCGAIVAYSGAIPFSSVLVSNIRSRPDVCVVHGTHDDVIPFEYFGESVSFLRDNNVPVVGHKISGLDHSISDEGIEIGVRFIKDRT